MIIFCFFYKNYEVCYLREALKVSSSRQHGSFTLWNIRIDNEASLYGRRQRSYAQANTEIQWEPQNASHIRNLSVQIGRFLRVMGETNFINNLTHHKENSIIPTCNQYKFWDSLTVFFFNSSQSSVYYLHLQHVSTTCSTTCSVATRGPRLPREPPPPPPCVPPFSWLSHSAWWQRNGFLMSINPEFYFYNNWSHSIRRRKSCQLAF